MFSCCFVLIIRRPPRATRTDTLFPYTTLFRSDHGARSKEWHWPQALRGVRNSAAAQVSARDRPALRTVRPPPPRPRPGAVDALMDARARETSPAAPEFDLDLRGKTRRSIGWTIKRTLSRSEEHTSELPSLMRSSYSVFSMTKTTNYCFSIHKSAYTLYILLGTYY